MSHIERLPNEVLHDILSQLDGKTLMVCIPQVCRRWRALCQDIQGVHLEFSWWKGGDGTVPVEVLAGWRQMPFVAGSGTVAALMALLTRRAVGRLACAGCSHGRHP